MKLSPIPKNAITHTTLAVLLGCLTLVSTDASGQTPDEGLPAGTVAFFNGSTCPIGWTRAAIAEGRLIVGVTSGGDVGVEVGTPLGDQEDRTHSHTATSNVMLTLKGVTALTGTNVQGAAAQAYSSTAQLAAASSGLPFVQLLACERQR